MPLETEGRKIIWSAQSKRSMVGSHEWVSGEYT